MSAHVEKVHSVTPKYTCDKCNFYISEKADYNTHIAVHETDEF